MRKIIEWCYVSADGVFQDPMRMGLEHYQDESYIRDAMGVFESCDAILWGRETYDIFASRWPGMEGHHPYASRLNSIKKYVFSSTLETADWNNTTLIRGNTIEEVSKLKREEGGNLLVLGHGLFGESLLRAGLTDVLDLSILSVIVGDGKTFFREGQTAKLRLATVKSFSGIVKLSYEVSHK